MWGLFGGYCRCRGFGGWWLVGWLADASTGIFKHTPLPPPPPKKTNKQPTDAVVLVANTEDEEHSALEVPPGRALV